MRAELRVAVLGPDEWAHWRDLRLQALQDTPIGFGERYADAVLRSDDEWRQVPLRRSLQLLAWEGHRPVGMAGGFLDDRGRPTLYAVFLPPGARGRGVLAALVDGVAEWARRQGAAELRLEVHEDNGRAEAAYRRLGFTATGVLRPYDLDPSRQLREMTRPL